MEFVCADYIRVQALFSSMECGKEEWKELMGAVVAAFHIL
jgi:hypothetical protein